LNAENGGVLSRDRKQFIDKAALAAYYTLTCERVGMKGRKRFTVFFILLLVLSTFVAVSHHHENTADDHDCPICVVSHHQPATGQSTVAFEGAPCFTEAALIAPSSVFTDNLLFFSLSTRGPPA
jgi:hypothetical protein